MISVTGPLWLWSGGQASWHFVTVPEELAGEIRAYSLAHRGGFGSVRVEAKINGSPGAPRPPAEIGRLHPAGQGQHPPRREHRRR